ncbi:hypothetical protein DBR27_18490 [Flavobacterium sp. HMWF030]|nr:hypothetical protein DBR27_18490 [Flavobacterium sp. HMWF030]
MYYKLTNLIFLSKYVFKTILGAFGTKSGDFRFFLKEERGNNKENRFFNGVNRTVCLPERSRRTHK